MTRIGSRVTLSAFMPRRRQDRRVRDDEHDENERDNSEVPGHERACTGPETLCLLAPLGFRVFLPAVRALLLGVLTGGCVAGVLVSRLVGVCVLLVHVGPSSYPIERAPCIGSHRAR